MSHNFKIWLFQFKSVVSLNKSKNILTVIVRFFVVVEGKCLKLEKPRPPLQNPHQSVVVYLRWQFECKEIKLVRATV